MSYPHLQPELDQDEYGIVFNSAKTFDGIATLLEKYGSVVIAWTEQQGSQIDLLLCVNPIQAGGLQRGLHSSDLFISIFGHGAFGFEIKDDELHPSYVAEKFRWGVVDVTITGIAELIMEVRKRLL